MLSRNPTAADVLSPLASKRAVSRASISFSNLTKRSKSDDYEKHRFLAR